MRPRLFALSLTLAACGTGRNEPAPASTPDAGTRTSTNTTSSPRPVLVARATAIPSCTVYVDAASAAGGDGSSARPHRTIGEAIAAAGDGATICVAEGTYEEALSAGGKAFTLAGGFARGFADRDSAAHPTVARGRGSGVFLEIGDPGPAATAVDGFEITGYAQGILRQLWYVQRIAITNCFIHDNACTAEGMAGAGFSLDNVSGTIAGNVFARNRCGRGGAGALNDSLNSNEVTISGNRFEANQGDEPGISHGGALYLFTNRLTISGNDFTGNTVTGWGAGLYLGAFSGGGQETNARLSWNVYRDNRAGIAGGGLFCDDSARCESAHEVYAANCGGNVYLDSATTGAAATVAIFEHLTSTGALSTGCGDPGAGVAISKGNDAADAYTIRSALFWNNGPDVDLSCDVGCDALKVEVAGSMLAAPLGPAAARVTLGAGMMAPLDPLFVAPAGGDFHLRSTRGHWTASGYVVDEADSPALATASRPELGAYGDSPEASR